jgi:2,4-dichlorophenol 6-monooxygenase
VLEAAHVLDARAGEELLESYEPERFPVDARNTQRAVENAMNHGALIRAIGIDPEDDPAVNVERSRLLWSDSAEGEALREVAHPVIASQSMEFNEQNVEFGHAYESAAVVPDGTPVVPPVDEIRVYEPGTRPGSPLPHAWVERHGTRIALRDLAPSRGFMLIAGEDGEDWCEAARDVARGLGLDASAVRIGHLEGDWLDPRCAWLRQRGFGRAGAILVRPDRAVAWRMQDAAEEPRGVLDDVLCRVLAL